MSIATLSTLEQADFTIKQARALTKVLEEDHQNLATKDDIKSIKKDIRFLEARMATKEETQSIRKDIEVIQEDIKDIQDDIKDIQDDIKDIRGDMKSMATEIGKLRYDTIKWIVAGIFFNGSIYALFKIFIDS